MKSKKTFLAIFAVLAAIIILGCVSYYKNINSAVDPNNTSNIFFQIKSGETARNIGAGLEEKGLIKSDLAFYLYVKFHNLGPMIISGRFTLNKTMTTKEIINNITDPAKAQAVITIQEGLKIKDIDKKLVDLGLTKSGEFIQAVKDFDGWQYYPFLNKDILEKLDLPLEGYVYPDTYFLNPVDFKPHDLIYPALDNFEKKTVDLLPKIKKHSVQQIITMASIIEKEVTGGTDRKIISGILWKRLENNWTLGADATLLYTKDDHKITSQDLQSDSPYNTRKVLGLPPTPICNPSLDSIQAAMYPENSPYWFYLTATDTGKVIYAKTNEEQNLNREKYL